MPVTFVTVEKRFKKIITVKNCMRTTMTQKRLMNLVFLSIESNLCEILEYNTLINSFEAKKINFL